MDQGDHVRIVGFPEICGQITDDDSQFIGQVGAIKDIEYMGDTPIYQVKLDNEPFAHWWPETSLTTYTYEEDLPLEIKDAQT